MEYIQPLKLIQLTPITDTIGNITFNETTTNVFCRENVVGSREFYNATAVGITPTAELQLRKVEYNGQEVVEYNGKRYAVIRTLPKGKFDVVLVIGIKEGV